MTYAERDAREVFPAKRFGGGRQGRGVLNKHRGGAREGRDKTKRFEALPETRSEFIVGCGELGEQTLLRAGHGGDEKSENCGDVAAQIKDERLKRY